MMDSRRASAACKVNFHKMGWSPISKNRTVAAEQSGRSEFQVPKDEGTYVKDNREDCPSIWQISIVVGRMTAHPPNITKLLSILSGERLKAIGVHIRILVFIFIFHIWVRM